MVAVSGCPGTTPTFFNGEKKGPAFDVLLSKPSTEYVVNFVIPESMIINFRLLQMFRLHSMLLS